VSFDNHRYDDNKPYVYRTQDYGKTWENISSNLPEKYSVYVVREDLVKPNLLFVGTEESVYASVNTGQTWHRMKANLPTVAIHDMVIHPREGDLIVGTHGRSLFIMDDISPLRQINEEIAKKPLHIFDNKVATNWHNINTGRKQPAFEFRGENPRDAAIINYYVGHPEVDSVTIKVVDETNGREMERKIGAHTGLNRTFWNYRLRYSESELKKYKTHLTGVIDELVTRVKNKDLKPKLGSIQKQLNDAETTNELNDIRSLMIKDFNGYAGGKMFFGSKLMPIQVTSGTYKIKISYGKEEAESSIHVREDPLDK
jgi:hypothetical protein